VVKGRFYTEQDNAERNHVAVLGSQPRPGCSPVSYPIGQRIESAASVHRHRRAEAEDDRGRGNVNREVHIPFKTMGDLKDMKYLDGIWMTYHGDHMAVEQACVRHWAAAHGFRPTDRIAIYVANLMEQLEQSASSRRSWRC